MATNSKEINILILGETGVGKSTFINGFANYLMYETLDEAVNCESLTSLIPSSFTMTDENYKDVVVETGSCDNENHGFGQSATQSSMVYVFQCGKVKIRIIDTPGIGDVRGPEQDKQNLEDIICTLSKYDLLHGIIILLKPNNARLGLMFRFCILELLTHLHKSAVDNLVFGFTNTRSTFYRPGETFPALRELLQANPEPRIELTMDTMYCFDSESYRFLAALKNGIKFSDKTAATFAESWENSVHETERLLKHIQGLEPHAIKHTLSLNAARNHIVQLARPMADIIRNVNLNILVCNEKIIELKNTETVGLELQKQLFVNKIDLEPKELPYPRTVCTNSACVQIVDFEGHMKTNYIRHCHEHCYIQNVKVDTVNTAALINCYAMRNGICWRSNCGHGYQEHMHIMYELLQVTKRVEDQNKRSQIDKNKSDVEMKQQFVSDLQIRIDEYRQEHKLIEEVAAKFGCFLKHNAITPYNNATIEYLDHLIKEETGKVQSGGDDTMLEGLEKAKGSIIEQIRVIGDSIKNGENEVLLEPETITSLALDLYKLKHFGANLKKLQNFSAKIVSGTFKEIAFNQPKSRQLQNRKRPKTLWSRITDVWNSD